jgi:hypothetical protein
MGKPGLRFGSVALFVFLIFALVMRYGKLISVPLTIILVRGTSVANRIRIIQDKNHDRILERIRSGRIARLRKLHLAVDFDNDPAAEVKKFRRLLDQGIIDDTEYLRAIGQLEARMHSSAPVAQALGPGRMLN